MKIKKMIEVEIDVDKLTKHYCVACQYCDSYAYRCWLFDCDFDEKECMRVEECLDEFGVKNDNPRH